MQQQQQQQMLHMQQLQAENQELRQERSPITESGSSKTKRPDRPTIDTDINDDEWALFIDSWNRYKSMCILVDAAEIRNELRAACSADVNRLLFDLFGPSTLNVATQEELLQHIKSVSVRGVHKEVNRQKFFKMLQSEAESITHFVARLKAQATLCEFKVACQSTTCDCVVSYADEMISNQMISGLRDQEHQTRLLAEAATLSTFAEKFDKLVSLETTDKSTPLPGRGAMNDSSTTNAVARSQYFRQKFESSKKDAMNQSGRSKCRGCGQTSHRDKPITLRKDFPANGVECFNCVWKGHFQSVCEQPKRSTTNMLKMKILPQRHLHRFCWLHQVPQVNQDFDAR